MTSNVFLFALGGLGFLISLYFALVYHKLMPPDARFVPKFCRLNKTSCESILAARDARVFGVPNFYLGLVFYSGIVAASLLPEVLNKAYIVLVVSSGFSVAMSLFLSYSLIIRLKTRCVLCFTSHIINLCIFVLL